MQTASAPLTHTHTGNLADAYYEGYLNRVAARFELLAQRHGALFTTNAANLWDVYLASYPERQRQYHTCNTCREFMWRFGGLVVIDDEGVQQSPIWDESLVTSDIDEVRAVARLRQHVAQAKVTGVFLSDTAGLGQAVTGTWRHLNVVLPAALVRKNSRVQTASQAMAEKLEDFRTMQHALSQFTRSQVDTALRLLGADTLYRSEKVVGPALFLSDLLAIRETPRRRITEALNLTWKRIAAAPAGFCHPRSSMVGTLLEDIAAGMDYETVERRFRAKMDPLAYQRPQAAPAAGAIAHAEKLVEQMGIAPSLARRFARPDELQPLWKPADRALARVTPGAGGVFAHLTPKSAAPAVSDMNVPAQTMTWVKFRRTVLEGASAIEINVPRRLSAIHFTTAADADAPPIIQWDKPEQRNPVAWYCWASGSMASQYYGLAAGTWHTISMVTLAPFQWADETAFAHQGARAVFLLDGVRESRQPSGCLFPEFLKAELHPVRSVVEAYSARATLAGMADGPHAIGLSVAANGRNTESLWIRVTEGGQRREIRIDRWD